MLKRGLIEGEILVSLRGKRFQMTLMGAGQDANRIDFAGVEEALRGLGLLYGAKRALSDVAAGATDEKTAIRTYLIQERPHLLQSYGIDALVELVHVAWYERRGHATGFEQFTPKS